MATKDTIRSYADAVNDIAAKLGSGVRTFSIAVPNAAAFYAPAENQHMLQTDMIAACYDRLKELKSTAIAVDAYSKLEAHRTNISTSVRTTTGRPSAPIMPTQPSARRGPQGRAAEQV